MSSGKEKRNWKEYKRPGRPKKKHFHGNQKVTADGEKIDDNPNSSTTAKQKLSSNDSGQSYVNSTIAYEIINFFTVFSALAEFVQCKNCGQEVAFSTVLHVGLAFKIKITCENCEPRYVNSCPQVSNHLYDINRRIIYVMRLLGLGYSQIAHFCGFMDLPRFLSRSVYDTAIKYIAKAAGAIAQISMKQATTEEKAMHEEEHNLAVSDDGSWRKRGFVSLQGISVIIGYRTGKILDVNIKSLYYAADKQSESCFGTEEYTVWLDEHEEECQQNHCGNAREMEVDGICEMFQRSMFNLKKTKHLGGKGKLTNNLIKELTQYYGNAIRSSSTVTEISRAIWATYYHKCSTNEEPQHEYCPPGPNSWCTWQKAKSVYSLSTYQHKPAIHPEVQKELKSVYEALSAEELLSRYLSHNTQNINESFHSLVWKIATKESFPGIDIVEIATNTAIVIFNDGYTKVLNIFKALEVENGARAFDMCCDENRHRLSDAERLLSST